MTPKMSKAPLIKAERAYSSQERETLAVVKACETFRHYIMGAHFSIRIYSDHKSLSQIKLNKVAANWLEPTVLAGFHCTHART